MASLPPSLSNPNSSSVPVRHSALLVATDATSGGGDSDEVQQLDGQLAAAFSAAEAASPSRQSARLADEKLRALLGRLSSPPAEPAAARPPPSSPPPTPGRTIMET
eukprot:SAG22_NODE_8782_length_630_cov_0.958569_1_plen_105_part_10